MLYMYDLLLRKATLVLGVLFPHFMVVSKQPHQTECLPVHTKVEVQRFEPLSQRAIWVSLEEVVTDPPAAILNQTSKLVLSIVVANKLPPLLQVRNRL